MDPRDKEQTTFVCHKGLFKFNMMPFGMSSACSIFQEAMSRALEGYEMFCTPYIDDILNFSPNLEDYLVHIRKVSIGCACMICVSRCLRAIL